MMLKNISRIRKTTVAFAAAAVLVSTACDKKYGYEPHGEPETAVVAGPKPKLRTEKDESGGPGANKNEEKPEKKDDKKKDK